MNEKKSRREFIKQSATAAAVLMASTNLAAGGNDEKTKNEKLKIAILLYDKMTALDAVGAYEVLSRMPNAQVMFVGETAGLKTVDTKMLTLRADYAIGDLPNPDILLIPGGDPRDPMKSEKILNWIREAHKTTRFTVSVCTGAMILGAAGLLKNLKATTHWATADLLKGFNAEYVAARYVQSGKIITAAGVSAGIDMALFLAEQLYDKATAEKLQLVIEYDPQPPFDSGSLRKADQKTVDSAMRYFAERKSQEEKERQ